MISKNAKQMLQTALRNAIPMHRQGYTCEKSPYTTHTFWVNKPERDADGNKIGYNVNTQFNLCNCEFYKKHKPVFSSECTCKHLEFAREIEAEDARIDAMVEANDQRELEQAEALNLLTESRTIRAHFDYAGHLPCHVLATKRSDLAAEDIAHVLTMDKNDGLTAAATAAHWDLPAASVQAFYTALDTLVEDTHR